MTGKGLDRPGDPLGVSCSDGVPPNGGSASSVPATESSGRAAPLIAAAPARSRAQKAGRPAESAAVTRQALALLGDAAVLSSGAVDVDVDAAGDELPRCVSGFDIFSARRRPIPSLFVAGRPALCATTTMSWWRCRLRSPSACASLSGTSRVRHARPAGDARTLSRWGHLPGGRRRCR